MGYCCLIFKHSCAFLLSVMYFSFYAIVIREPAVSDFNYVSRLVLWPGRPICFGQRPCAFKGARHVAAAWSRLHAPSGAVREPSPASSLAFRSFNSRPSICLSHPCLCPIVIFFKSRHILNITVHYCHFIVTINYVAIISFYLDLLTYSSFLVFFSPSYICMFQLGIVFLLKTFL